MALLYETAQVFDFEILLVLDLFVNVWLSDCWLRAKCSDSIRFVDSFDIIL